MAGRGRALAGCGFSLPGRGTEGKSDVRRKADFGVPPP